MLSRFSRDTKGSVTVEAVIILPLLVWWFVASYAYFDAFNERNVNLKAAYALSDLLSREMGTVDADYMEGLDDVFQYMTGSSDGDSYIRVSLLRCSANCGADDTGRVLFADWSYATGAIEGYSTDTNDSDNLESRVGDQIPIMPAGDRVIVVETFMDYESPFTGGLSDRVYDNFIVTRPRFVPKLDWDDGGTS
ncbi:TadE/TadG family type IV pilus assembly protein [Rhodovulum iodosum]